MEVRKQLILSDIDLSKRSVCSLISLSSKCLAQATNRLIDNNQDMELQNYLTEVSQELLCLNSSLEWDE